MVVFNRRDPFLEMETFVSKTAAYSAVAVDRGKTFLVSGTWTFGLLAAATAGAGFPITIKKTDDSITGGVITIDANSTETIDGALTLVLRLKNNSVTLVSDGTNWQVVESHLPSERGSNSNGEYARFADGTQVCNYAYTTASIACNSALGSVYINTALTTWTFPAAFVSGAIPTVFGMAKTGGSVGYIVPNDGYPTNTTINPVLVSQVAVAGAAFAIQYSATGRWF